MSEPYRYHASTTGVWGDIREPFHEIIPVQASLSLPATGGFGTAHVDRFDFRGIVKFESVSSLVSGSPGRDSYDSTATVTITGLNILNVVTADRVVARIAVESPEDAAKPLFITPIGSHFENLRIAGYPVNLDLATDQFHGLEAPQSVSEAQVRNQRFQEEVESLASTRTAFKGYLEKCLHRLKPGAVQKCAATTCSLVRKIDEVEKLPEELRPKGHVIHVRGFGFIRLAEFRITEAARSITMLQVDLGSSPSGSSGAGGASGGGGSDP